jgi:hypothetical protein
MAHLGCLLAYGGYIGGYEKRIGASLRMAINHGISNISINHQRR